MIKHIELLKAKGLFGYNRLKSFQMVGSIEKIPDEEKQELFPYFAYIYSQQLDPEKYGSVSSMEEWTKLIQSNEDDINKIAAAAEELTDDDWTALKAQYAEAQTQNETQTQYAKKGTVLKKANQEVTKAISNPVITKGKKGGKARKCKCGCAMVLSKSKGGKLIESCACKCGGKMKKKK